MDNPQHDRSDEERIDALLTEVADIVRRTGAIEARLADHAARQQ